MSDVKSVIESGRAVLGIEFGSTRIKAVLIGEDHAPIATGLSRALTLRFRQAPTALSRSPTPSWSARSIPKSRRCG